MQKQPPDVFYKKGVPKISQNSQENTCAKVSFFIKLSGSCWEEFWDRISVFVLDETKLTLRNTFNLDLFPLEGGKKSKYMKKQICKAKIYVITYKILQNYLNLLSGISFKLGWLIILALFSQSSISIPPENVRKPLLFYVFMEYKNGTLG